MPNPTPPASGTGPASPASVTSPAAADAMGLALSQLSSATRGSTSVYGNVRPNVGSGGPPQRLISDIGFPDEVEFTTLPPAMALIAPVPAPRTITTITLHPFGLDTDYRTITSTRSADKRIRTTSSPTARGLRAVPETVIAGEELLMCANSDDNTYASIKTSRVVNAMASSQQGPAYHFVISRNGDIIVGAPLDYTTTASSTADAANTIDVGLEGCFAITRDNHTARQFDSNLIELPYTILQIISLTVLVVKLQTAYPGIPATLVGVVYSWNDSSYSDAPQYNFSNGSWVGSESPFDYTLSDAPAFFNNLSEILPFDLSTEIFQLNQAPPPIVTRAPVQTAIASTDTAGQLAVLLGSYSDIACRDRSADMQGAQRVDFFIERQNVATANADDNSSSSADVTAAQPPPPLTPATNTQPSKYDDTSGRWADNGNSY